MNPPKQTERELLAGLPSSSLFDLARNGAARWNARKAAVALLLKDFDPRAKHPELAELVYEVAAETLSGCPDTPWEDPRTVAQPSLPFGAPKPESGPFRASVTTDTMFRNEESPNRFDFRDSEVQQPKWIEDSPVPVYSKPTLPQQPIVSVDVPPLKPFDPEQ